MVGMAGKVYIKEFVSEGELVVAVCDEELLGKTISDGRIKIYVDPSFYGGRLVDVEEALRIIDRSTIANLIGRRIVDAAIKHGLVHPEAVTEINGIPHAQIIRI